MLGSRVPVAAAEPNVSSGAQELRPALDEVVVLVHQRVPHRDVAEAVPVRAAVADLTLFDDDRAEWIGHGSRTEVRSESDGQATGP